MERSLTLKVLTDSWSEEVQVSQAESLLCEAMVAERPDVVLDALNCFNVVQYNILYIYLIL